MLINDNIQAISNLISSIVLNGVNFALLVFFTHFLTTADYGIVAIYTSYTALAAVFIGLSTNGSVGIAFVHIDEEERKDYFASILFLSCISFCFFAILALVFRDWLIQVTELEGTLLVLILLHSFGIFCFNFVTLKYIFARTAQYSCILAIVLASVMLGMALVGIKIDWFREKQYYARILSIAVPYILCAIFTMIIVFSNGNPFKAFRKHVSFCLPICLPIIFHLLAQIVLAQTGNVMLQKIVRDNSVVGIYGFIVTFSHVLNTVIMALNNTWVPIFMENFKLEKVDIILKRTRMYCSLVTKIVVGFYLVCPEFIRFLAKKDYWVGIMLIPIVGGSMFMTFLYLFPVNFEFFHKESRLAAIGTCGAALINLLLNYFLIPRFSMYGAAVSMLIAYGFLVIFHNFSARLLIRSEYPYKFGFFARYFVYIFLASGIFYFVLDYPIIRWVLAILTALVIIKSFLKERVLF